jgi:hypothetical protein
LSSLVPGRSEIRLGKNIAPHIPVWERDSSAGGMFSRSEFTYDAVRDVYVCPNGRLLRTSGTVHESRVRNYLSHPGDCRACTLKQRCTRAPFKEDRTRRQRGCPQSCRSLKGTPEFERSSTRSRRPSALARLEANGNGDQRSTMKEISSSVDVCEAMADGRERQKPIVRRTPAGFAR